MRLKIFNQINFKGCEAMHFKSKKEIINRYTELELTSKGDFKVKNQMAANYEIIDFHTHIFESIGGIIPVFFRQPKYSKCSFFNLSAYPGGICYFDFDKVGYKNWPKDMLGISGLKTFWYNMGLPAMKVTRNATYKRLLEDLKEINIEKAVILPINSKDFNSTEELLTLDVNTEKTILFGSLHPYEDKIDEKLDSFVARGIKGFKINPHIMNVDIDDIKMIDLIKKVSKKSLPIISCSGYQLPGYVKNVPSKVKKQLSTQEIEKFKRILGIVEESIFIFAHGGMEENDKLIPLMKEYHNTYTDVSTQSVANIKKMIAELGAERLVFGSDYPFLSPALTVLSVLKATKSEKERKYIFSDNAKHILKI